MRDSTFAQGILDFFSRLRPPGDLPAGVEVLWPYGREEVLSLITAFYRRFYSDDAPRVFLIGINPGRFGAGVTGVSFTDPLRMAQDCGIPHSLPGGRELSSDFVYRVIARMGGPEDFFRRYYLTALSPVGFIQEGKNFNYYDAAGFADSLEPWMKECLEDQIAAGARRRVAFSLGQGKNYQALRRFNQRWGFFDKVEALPHPRWVMQYRRSRMEEFLELYRQKLTKGAE